jgi:1,4-dihydroxy-6-naphthoate synthase
MSQTIRIGHSPDSDDAFMFYALAEHKLDTGELRYLHELADIETLNRRALAGELEVSAVSIHAYAYLADRYALLASGSSMGDGYGPRLVARRAPPGDPRTALCGRRVAVPGLRTTAYLALRLYQPDIEPVVVPFDQVGDAVKRGAADVALVIHEGQLTFAADGFHLWQDLGAWWLAETGLPLPLGGNAVRRDLGPEMMARLTRLVRETVRYSLAHRKEALEYAMSFARGMDPGVADRFVGMWVNEMTIECGETGRRAVQTFLDRGHAAGVIPRRVTADFVEA